MYLFFIKQGVIDPDIALIIAWGCAQLVPRPVLMSNYTHSIPYGDFDPVQFALRFRFGSVEELQRVVRTPQNAG